MEMSIRFPGLGLVFDYVPRSFQIFGMEFTIYGVLIAVGALLGMGLVTLEAKRNGEDQNRYLDMILISLLVSVAGSRLFYVAFSWGFYKEKSECHTGLSKWRLRFIWWSALWISCGSGILQDYQNVILAECRYCVSRNTSGTGYRTLGQLF